MDFLRSKVDYTTYFSLPSYKESKLSLLSLGKLHLSGGSIVASDPLVCLGRSLAFNKTVAAGSYPVTACITHNAEYGERVALVKVDFNQEPVTHWEMALTEYDDVTEMTKEDDFFGFPVDSGLASFCDADTQEVYDRFTEKFIAENPEKNIYTDYFDALFQQNATSGEATGNWLNFTIPGASNRNVIMFSSGLGDGNYPCYWGLNAKEEVCCLVVDFFVLSH